jgi:methylphosphotriester-DNA--protein-cysteine methyltransferase
MPETATLPTRAPCTCSPHVRECLACRAYHQRVPRREPYTPPAYPVSTALDAATIQARMTETQALLDELLVTRDTLRQLRDHYGRLAPQYDALHQRVRLAQAKVKRAKNRLAAYGRRLAALGGEEAL